MGSFENEQQEPPASPTFHEMVSEMLSKHINLRIRPESISSRSDNDDGVLSYAEEVLTLSLLRAEFQDAIRKATV